jgi:hypothetical protein
MQTGSEVKLKYRPGPAALYRAFSEVAVLAAMRKSANNNQEKQVMRQQRK